MRNRFDQFAKLALQALLSPAGTVETDHEVSPEARHIDLWFLPDPPRAAALSALGLLGRLAPAAGLAAFTSPPLESEQRIREDALRKGEERGLRRGLLSFYQARFGPVPPAVRTRIEATADPDTLTRWSDLIARSMQEDVDRVLAGA